MPNFQLTVDRLSFWLGFLAASLLWWIFLRIRPLFPQWREQIRQNIDTISQRNLSGVEEYLRRETLRRAQRQHLAARLFSLDEILIQPKLLVPPGGQDPTVTAPQMSIAGQFLPYLPDWPELVSPLGAPTLTPLQAIQTGRHLAIIGQAGSGRTVALAHLASQIARQEPSAGKYSSAVPLFVHALEIDPTLVEDKDPLLNLIKVIAGNASVVMQPQIPRFLQSVFRDKQRRVVLFLDGLDELSPSQMAATMKFLTGLQKKHARLQIIATAAADYIDGMTRANFYPLSLAAWNQPQRMELAKKWGELWTNQLLPETKKQGQSVEIDPLLIQNWLSNEYAYASPLEWSLRLWGAYAGDLSGSSPLSILDSYLTRFLPKPAYIPALEELAHQMVIKQATSLGFTKMDQILSSYEIAKQPVPVTGRGNPEPGAGATEAGSSDTAMAETNSLAAEEPQAETISTDSAKKKKSSKKSRRETTVSRGEEIVNALTDAGVMVEFSNHQIRFANPVFLAFLAGMRLSPDEAASVAQQAANKLDWPVAPLVLQYNAACTDNPEWVYSLIEDPVAPLFRNLLLAARWLRDAPSNAEWRSHIMRILVNLLQNEALPFGSRARLVAAFYLSRDPSTAKLFRQLLLSRSAIVRQATLLGCGVLGNPQLINDILGLLADSVPAVRYTACLALAAVPGEAALNTVVEILLTGDEEIRQASAEALALMPPDGHKVLEEAATVDDLLTSRAAVFGLFQVNEPWAQKLLEKMAVEDGQWVVRNAAGQALDSLQQTTPLLPRSLPKPSESPWLITFASRFGMGLLPGQPATDVLLSVLKSGSIEEQIAALFYLRDQADEGVIRAIYEILYSGQEQLQEPVIHALWWIASTGYKLPSPTQFGLG
jgi:HEAT repeat protein